MAVASAAQRVSISLECGCANQLGLRTPCLSALRQAAPRTSLSSSSSYFSTRKAIQVVNAQHGRIIGQRLIGDCCRQSVSHRSREDNGMSLQRRMPLAIIIVSLSILSCLFGGCAQASEAIKASSLGLKVASFLRRTGWPDEAIVFLLATLPVLELRGAIPVGYWMQMDPLKISALSVFGNMVPVPFLILYLERAAKFLSSKSSTAKRIVDAFFESIRKKAAPVQEFEWLGLMLFVAVPFPGTGAWTGAMVASVLGMSFWEAMSANFCGVIMAGFLVNLLVNLGLNYAILVGVVLFLTSSFMWGLLRVVRGRQ